MKSNRIDFITTLRKRGTELRDAVEAFEMTMDSLFTSPADSLDKSRKLNGALAVLEDLEDVNKFDKATPEEITRLITVIDGCINGQGVRGVIKGFENELVDVLGGKHAENMNWEEISTKVSEAEKKRINVDYAEILLKMLKGLYKSQGMMDQFRKANDIQFPRSFIPRKDEAKSEIPESVSNEGSLKDVCNELRGAIATINNAETKAIERRKAYDDKEDEEAIKKSVEDSIEVMTHYIDPNNKNGLTRMSNEQRKALFDMMKDFNSSGINYNTVSKFISVLEFRLLKVLGMETGKHVEGVKPIDMFYGLNFDNWRDIAGKLNDKSNPSNASAIVLVDMLKQLYKATSKAVALSELYVKEANQIQGTFLKPAVAVPVALSVGVESTSRLKKVFAKAKGVLSKADGHASDSKPAEKHDRSEVVSTRGAQLKRAEGARNLNPVKSGEPVSTRGALFKRQDATRELNIPKSTDSDTPKKKQ